MAFSPPLNGSALQTVWPLLRACCAVPPDRREVAELASNAGGAEAVLRLSELHGVLSHMAAAFHQSTAIPAELRDGIHFSFRNQAMAGLSMSAELFRVTEKLQQAGIEFLATKGPALAARAYGDPSARRYIDLDLLLRHRDIAGAVAALCSIGYTCNVRQEAIQSEQIPGEYIFRREDTPAILELHTERSFRFFPKPMPLENFFRRQTSVALDGRRVPTLCPEDEFVLISVHGAKHFWERLMWVADVAAMVHNCPEIDWKRVKKTATEVGAGRMVRVALLLANRVLRSQIPPEMEREVAADGGVAKIVRKIETWLPYAGNEPPALLQRALFRWRMRGELFAGAGYLTRLSLSTTEEDWSSDSQSVKGSLLDSLRRPLRLAKKYRRESKEPRDG